MGWVDKQVNNVKRFVADPGKSVNNLFKDVGNTVTNLLKDPKALAVLAINIYAPGAGSAIGAAMGITNLTAAAFIGNTVLNTALNGGDVNAAAKSAALAIGGAKLADTVTAGLADTTISTATKKLIGNTAASATIAAIQGKDPMAAIAAGGISYGVSAITSQYDGFDKLPAASQKAVRTVLTGALSGAKDAKITSDLVYGAIGSGIQAYKNVSDGNAATQKELGRDLTDEEAKKLALYSSANTASTDIKNLVVGEKSTKAIESGQSSYTYDGKPVAVSGTDINNYFKDKLTTAGITPTTADISAASTAYSKSKDAAGATNAVVDSRSVDAQEVKDIYAKEGVTNLTPQQIEKYVKSNVDEATVLADIQKQVDADWFSRDEALKAFEGTGFTPTDADLAKYVGGKDDAAQIADVKQYADTNSTDIDEVKSAFKDIYGRDPNANELKDLQQFVGNQAESTLLPKEQAYLDPKYVDTGESTAYLKSILGRDPTQKEIAAFVGEKPEDQTLTKNNVYDTLVDLLNNTQHAEIKANDYSGQAIQAISDEIQNIKLAQALASPSEMPGYQRALDSATNRLYEVVKSAANDPEFKQKLPALEAILESSGLSIARVMSAATVMGLTPSPTNQNEEAELLKREPWRKNLTGYYNPNVPTTAAPASDTPLEWDAKTKSWVEIPTYDWYKNVANVNVDDKTTADEAEKMFESVGYKPTAQELERFVKNQSDSKSYQDIVNYVENYAPTKSILENQDLLSEPAAKQKTVAQQDIDQMTKMATGKIPVDEKYDVTGDKKVTQADIDFLTRYLPTTDAPASDKPIEWDAKSKSWVETPTWGNVSPVDVTGDGKVTQQDIDIITSYLPEANKTLEWDEPTKTWKEVPNWGIVTPVTVGDTSQPDFFNPTDNTYWSPTGVYKELDKQQEARNTAIKTAAATANKIAAIKNKNQQKFTNYVMANMAGNSPSGNVSTVAPPVSTVEAAPVFSFDNPLDIGFFNQQTDTKKDTQTQPGVVKIAQGGYMDMLHPHETGGMDEILRILEGK